MFFRLMSFFHTYTVDVASHSKSRLAILPNLLDTNRILWNKWICIIPIAPHLSCDRLSQMESNDFLSDLARNSPLRQCSRVQCGGQSWWLRRGESMHRKTTKVETDSVWFSPVPQEPLWIITGPSERGGGETNIYLWSAEIGKSGQIELRW